jgi:hypothetical protein
MKNSTQFNINIRKALLLLLIAFGMISFAQTGGHKNEKLPSRIKLINISISKENFITRSHDTRFSNHESFLEYCATENGFLKEDMGYDWTMPLSGKAGSKGRLTSYYSFCVGFQPFGRKPSEKKNNQEFRLGTNLNRYIVSTTGRYSQNISGDTMLMSTAKYHGESIYLCLDAAYIFKTDQKKRFSAYSGFGINYGTSIRSIIYRTTYSYTYLNSYGPNSYVATNLNGKQSAYSAPEKMQSSYLVSAYILFGCDFRIAKSAPILKNMMIFTNGKINLTAINYNLGADRLNKSLNFEAGLKYNFNREAKTKAKSDL